MVFIFSAPSGAGKSTLVNHLLSVHNDLEFSVSATTRPPRGKEQHGKEYYFISNEEFQKLIEQDKLLEYENVYSNTWYGTPRSEIERIEQAGHHVVFDVDVKGGINLKRIFGERACSFFIAPPSIDELRRRLIARATDSPEKIDERVNKAETEMKDAPFFDHIIVNDDLDRAKAQINHKVETFLS